MHTKAKDIHNLKDTRVASKSSKFRWMVLLMLVAMVFSMIYCYDNLFALQKQLQETYNLSPMQYNLLYSVNGFINIIAPLFSCILIDCLGINTSSLLFYTLVVVGQSIWIFGSVIKSYPVMVTGRGLFGCGTQQFHCSRKYLLGKFFIGKEYLFASGLTISSSRSASAVSSLVSAVVYKDHGLIPALSVGEILVIISLLFLITFIIYDKSISKMNKKRENAFIQQHQEEKRFYLVDGLKAFDRRFWFLTMALVTFYSSYLSFANVQSAFLQSTYHLTFQRANDLSGIPFFIATVMTPLFGFAADRYGRKLLLLFVAAILLTASHCVLGFVPGFDPVVGLIGFGMAMSLGSAVLWPMVLLVVDEKYHATALGISSSFDNGGQAVSYMILGALTIRKKGEHENYRNVSIWITSLAAMTIIFTILLWHSDADKLLNRRLRPSRESSDGSSVQSETLDVSMSSGSETVI